MEKEFVTLLEKELTIRISNTTIEAIRVKDLIKKGVRVYDNGSIGVSGAVGDVSDDILTKEAQLNLETEISYPYELSTHQEHRDYSQEVDEVQFNQDVKDILQHFKKNYPHLVFSQGASLESYTKKMTNTKGLDVSIKDQFVNLQLIMKDTRTPNVIDGACVYSGRSFDKEKYLAFNDQYLQANEQSVLLPDKDRLPVFMIDFDTLNGFLNKQLNGEMYALGTSIYDQKLGEKIMGEHVSIYQSRTSNDAMVPFFDGEGTVNPNDRIELVKNGILKNVFTDKKVAYTYGYPLTGAASGGYDDIPRLMGTSIALERSTQTMKEALQGQMAIFVLMMAGGDFTSEGQFASPVQISFLFDGEKLIGRLPEFTMSNHISKMLNEDYIGNFNEECLYFGEFSNIVGMMMDITKE